MTEEEDNVESGLEVVKPSKRERLKGALARTKTKFKKQDKAEENEYKLSDDVNDFLAAGRPSSSSRPSISDSRSFASASDRPSTSESAPRQLSPFPQHEEPFVSPHQSPRKIVVPRIDVSNSQRWPNANLVESRNIYGDNRLLRPDYQERSRSANAYSEKKRGRARGLSVTFREDPPVVIGEGGDEAQTPPVEISRARARARARSESPMYNRPQQHVTVMDNQRSPPVKRKPIPTQNVQQVPPYPLDTFRPRVLQRAQTGPAPISPESKLALDREFEMSLQLSAGSSPDSPVCVAPLHAPRPIRPPVPIPQVREPPSDPEHSLKPVVASSDLRMQFEEGEVLRQSRRHQNLSEFE